MAELVGVVAAAAQLATACLSLLDATKRIKGVSSTLRKYQVQLENIQQISLRITENPLLQTPEVENQTQSILLIVKESNLALFHDKSRFSQAWTLIRQERSLLENFHALERHKTSLLLVLDSIQATTLHNIHLNVSNMSQKKSSSSTHEHPPAYLDPHTFAMPFANMGTTDVIATKVEKYTGRPGKPEPSNSCPSSDTTNSGPGGAIPTMRFSNSTATHGDQVNGYSIEVGPGMEQTLSGITFEGASYHSFSNSFGSGLQVNGLLVDCLGTPKAFRIPGADIECLGATKTCPIFANQVVEGMQVNGTHLRLRGARGNAAAQGRK